MTSSHVGAYESGIAVYGYSCLRLSELIQRIAQVVTTHRLHDYRLAYWIDYR